MAVCGLFFWLQQRFFQLILTLLLVAASSLCDEKEHCDVNLLQMDWSMHQSALELFHQQLRQNSSTPLSWQTLRHFDQQKAAEKGGKLLDECSNIGRRYPALVSRNASLLEEYRRYACEVAPDYFITDPQVALTAEVASMENGCINLQAQPKVLLAMNGTHRYYAYRRCTGRCFDEWHQLSHKVVNEDLLVLPSIRTPPGMVYQHALSDVLPIAFTVLDHLKRFKNSKLVIHSPIHAEMLRSIGIASEQLLEIPLTTWEAQTLLCVAPGRRMTLWRAARADRRGGGELPTLNYGDHRIFSDYWWRLVAFRVAPEVSQLAQTLWEAKRTAKLLEEEKEANSVVFLQRCTERRPLQNEQGALATVSHTLVASQRDFDLISFCPGREDFWEQLRKVRRARLIIGAHGGELANMLLSQKGTGVIELVGNPAAQEGLQGEFPPYKSMWYGGAGSSFAFYRIVLYEPSLANDSLSVRLEDLQEAVQQWLDLEGKQMDW